MFMPDAGKPTAYPTRTETTFRRTSRRRNTQRVFLCRGGRRVGMQACPFGSSLAQTTTKYAQESLRALSFRKQWISPLLKASPECPLRDMRQASRLDGGWRCENCTAVRTVLAMAKLRTAGVTGLYSYTDCSGCGKTAGDFQCTERAR